MRTEAGRLLSRTAHQVRRQAAKAGHLLSQFKTQVQEWKNTLLRGKDPEQLGRYWTAFNTIEKAVVADEVSNLARCSAAARLRGQAERLIQAVVVFRLSAA